MEPVFAPEGTSCRHDNVGRVDQTAGGASASLYLDDRRGSGVDGVCKRVRKRNEQFIGHTGILTAAPHARITQTGCATE
jgi:hypothetical protein